MLTPETSYRLLQAVAVDLPGDLAGVIGKALVCYRRDLFCSEFPDCEPCSEFPDCEPELGRLLFILDAFSGVPWPPPARSP